jgi:peptide-methionine (S)-S-oxide reductase
MGLLFVRMKKLQQVLVALAVLATALAIGAARNKPAVADLAHYETATLAGGCFWGLQESLRQIPGVIKTTAGYTGGTTANPTYELVAAGKTGHTEAVEVVFDPAKLSYEKLLTDFLTARNPLPASRARAPHRSVIFFHSATQQQTAGRVQDQLNQSGRWSSPVVAEIAQATTFYPAEEYHQDYYRKSSAARACSLE